MKISYKTKMGQCWFGDALKILPKKIEDNSINLIMTSPPYALLKKKDYGNVEQNEYIEWFRYFANEFHRILKEDGSLVINIGSAWNKGIPTKSLYHYELLLDLCNRPDDPSKRFHLAQETFWHNPAKMPLPVQWVNVKRIRIKETVENIFWLSKTPHPKASNKKVLTPYKKDMKKLLKTGKYNQGRRPSGSLVTDKWGKDNGGAIPSNLLNYPNTGSGSYRKKLRDNELTQHPAMYPESLPEFFIKLCTNENDIVLDPFSGSNTTGFVAENLKRKWISIDSNEEYVKNSKLRFKS